MATQTTTDYEALGKILAAYLGFVDEMAVGWATLDYNPLANVWSVRWRRDGLFWAHIMRTTELERIGITPEAYGRGIAERLKAEVNESGEVGLARPVL